MISPTCVIDLVLDHEKGFTVDTGGPTNWGVTLASLIEAGDWDGDGYVDGDFNRDGRIDIVDVKNMTMEEAESFYLSWWDKLGYGGLASQDVANKVFDMSVNMGPGQAAVLVQRAANSCGCSLKVDGVLGPKTRAALNSLPLRAILPALRSQMKTFYNGLATADPKRFGDYLGGWLNRAEC